MININIEKCTGCGLCVKDCPSYDIKIEDNKAHPLNKSCIGCGHCIAICPENSVVIDNYDMKEVKEFDRKSFSLKSENLLNFIKFRRSSRQFNKKKIEKEKIQKIIEAGRFTASGGNRQPLSYIVVQKKMDELTRITIDVLYKYACDYEPDDNNPLLSQSKRYSDIWKFMHDQYERGIDALFYNAPVMIIVLNDNRLSSNSTIDGSSAASNMELMANSLHLAACFNGYFTYASQDESIKNFLYIPYNVKVVTSLLIGYTDVKYLRTVPRKKPDIQWM